MAFTSSKTGFCITGQYKVKTYAFTSTGVTNGSIVHGMKSVIATVLSNKTGMRAGQAINDTTTPGTVALSGLTSGDAGYLIVTGK